MSAGRPRQVWVLRHAKAGPHGAADHARALTDRGRRQCAELAAHLVEAAASGMVPPLVLVSSATRALQTAELVVAALGVAARVEVEPALYQADVDEVVELLRTLDDDLPSVMVVGHNPTFEELVWLLLEDEGRRAFEGLSTGALAVVELDVATWTAVTPGVGRLLSLYRPTSR